jgi:hypothetical protein
MAVLVGLGLRHAGRTATEAQMLAPKARPIPAS